MPLSFRVKLPQTGEIYTPMENPYEPPRDPNNQEDVIFYELAVARDDAFVENRQREYGYLTRFSNWLVDYQAGREIGPRGQGDPNAQPPQPPHGVNILVGRAEDGSLAYNQIETGPPVCGIPTYAKMPIPQSWGNATTQLTQNAVEPGLLKSRSRR